MIGTSSALSVAWGIRALALCVWSSSRSRVYRFRAILRSGSLLRGLRPRGQAGVPTPIMPPRLFQSFRLWVLITKAKVIAIKYSAFLFFILPFSCYVFQKTVQYAAFGIFVGSRSVIINKPFSFFGYHSNTIAIRVMRSSTTVSHGGFHPL